MPREIGPCPERPLNADPWRDCEKMDLDVQVITPMFGGGVEAGKPDPVTPIRATEIRGHLRFWWRATRGATCDTVQKLRQRETEIWGDTENPSKVIVETKVTNRGEAKPCAHLPPNKTFPKFEQDHPGYALCPFQGNVRKNEPIGKGLYGLGFHIHLIYPQQLASDVNAALWAWLNFGGIGARTRRGCGALCCSDFAPPSGSLDALRKWFVESWSKLGLSVSRDQRDWSVLGPGIFVSKQMGNALGVWNTAVDLLRRFRQGDNIGRNPGQGNRPGRSRWPEPEAVRRAAGRRAHAHQRLEHVPDQAYPRAEFGLPIIFHFKDNGEPSDTALIPTCGTDRFSSPLILRPLLCADGNCLAMAVFLCGPLPSDVHLKPVGGGSAIETRNVRDPALATYRSSPLGPPKDGAPPRSASGSALEGFASFIQEPEQDFQRVEVQP